MTVASECSKSPVNKGPEQQPDGLLNVFSAQPAPLPLHQQAQDVKSHISQCSFSCCTYNMRDKQMQTLGLAEKYLRHKGRGALMSLLRANIINCFKQLHVSHHISASYIY